MTGEGAGAGAARTGCVVTGGGASGAAWVVVAAGGDVEAAVAVAVSGGGGGIDGPFVGARRSTLTTGGAALSVSCPEDAQIPTIAATAAPAPIAIQSRFLDGRGANPSSRSSDAGRATAGRVSAPSTGRGAREISGAGRAMTGVVIGGAAGTGAVAFSPAGTCAACVPFDACSIARTSAHTPPP